MPAASTWTTLRNLPFKVIEWDEIWSFCYSKAKNVSKLTTIVGLRSEVDKPRADILHESLKPTHCPRA